MPADGGIRFGNYLLLRRLARGGMAEVFLAQQRGLEGFDRRVAVKRILPHLVDSPDFVKMFLGEAKLAAQLTHPNIVHIYEFGKVDHDYFIAMEYVEGVHAGQVFKQPDGARMSPTMVARLGADAAAALHYAHELRSANGKPLDLVHRDVSPANLMVSYDGVVKLCDFGIAKAAALSDQRTNPGQVKGKYAYMSPEQTVAAPLDGRSDVFALAIVLWELLAGKTIVPRGDPIAAMRAIRDGKIQPIAQAAPATPPALAEAVTRALATRREERPTAVELATTLEAFIKASPELATPMHVGAWVRTHFPREVTGLTGPQQAIPLGASGPGTMAGPGTVGGTAGGTVGGTGGTIGAGTGTRIVSLTPPVPFTRSQRYAGDAADDGAETLALVGDPEAGRETILLDDRALPVSKRVTARHMIAPDPTLLDDPARRAPLPTPHRSGARGLPPPPLPVPPAASAPTLIDPRLHVAPIVTGTEAISGLRRRASRRLALAGGLAGIALGSFLVALVVCSPSRTTTPPEAPIAIAPVHPDAARPTPPPPPSDAAAPREPTLPPDAAIKLQLYKVDTRPSGGTVRIGDQTRATPAELMLAPGAYTVIAELDGWHPETRAIELVDGADLVQEIPFTRRIAARPASQTGTLTVRTTPYSDVYLGTRKIGQAPFADKELPAGTYTLTFKNPLHPTVKKQVTIVPGKLTKLPAFALPPR